jgi:hypothetical protein
MDFGIASRLVLDRLGSVPGVASMSSLCGDPVPFADVGVPLVRERIWSLRVLTFVEQVLAWVRQLCVLLGRSWSGSPGTVLRVR